MTLFVFYIDDLSRLGWLELNKVVEEGVIPVEHVSRRLKLTEVLIVGELLVVRLTVRPKVDL